MKLKIAVLPGDGIGPEIMRQGTAVMDAVAEKFGHEVEYREVVCGAHAIDLTGNPFPDDTFETCRQADAVLFAAVGDLRFDNDPMAKVRPEQGLLAMRKKLGLFANIRPVQTFKCLLHKSPLKDELIDGADFICIRELTGGMYFGEKYQDNDKAYDTDLYTRPEIERSGSLINMPVNANITLRLLIRLTFWHRAVYGVRLQKNLNRNILMSKQITCSLTMLPCV